MQYSVKHVTKFKYLGPVRESAMEVRLQPRSDERQKCFSFRLDIEPSSQANSYVDHAGNVVHYFDIAAQHAELRLESRAVVDVVRPVIPTEDDSTSWELLDRSVETGDFWDYLHESQFIRQSEALMLLADTIDLARRQPPLSLLRELSRQIYSGFEYQPLTTHANSPIDEALENRAGVCQDFAHIFIALARRLGIPCRYVSGYLYHRSVDHDRSAQDASHAWVEAYLPEFGWLGLDPTNNIVAGDRHIVIAVGRDYADVPPTKGVFKGIGASELQVGVRVVPATSDERQNDELPLANMPHIKTPEEEAAFEEYQQQQQQQ
ncbi:MAG: transglutaminase family protein [Rhodothermales bacterium]|nr:transglutaminase family protein [Rhodothermales bacterium]